MSNFIGRRREIEALTRALESPGPGLVLLHGSAGIGKSRLLREALELLRHRSAPRLPGRGRPVVHAFAPLPAPDQRRLLAASVRRGEPLPATDPGTPPPTGSWSALFEVLRGPDQGWTTDPFRPRLLVLDDAHHLLSHGAPVAEALLEFWKALRARALPVHLVLSGRDPELSARWAELPDELRDAPTLDLSVDALSFREVTGRLEGWTARDRVRAWAICGGRPANARELDPSATLATSVRRAFLRPDAPLVRAGVEALDGRLQSPARYFSLLRVLSAGARDWSAIRERADDFGSGSQIAPYLAKLEELGVVAVERSLDAAPGGRRRRYHVTDPSLAFWWRFVLPAWSEIQAGRGDEVWGGGLPSDLDGHVAAWFPRLCRSWLFEHGDEAFPTRAREVGGLWGADYDLDVSGTLRNGAALYGRALWTDDALSPAHFDAVDADVRNTRYGFGREARLRVLFTSGPVSPEVRRRAAREVGTRVVEIGTIAGGTVDEAPRTGA